MEHAKLPLEMPETKKDEGPVTCLGMTFENDQERREYFTEILRQKLPELKKIEGYPIGEDEDILALSDPPYYTACPNPFIKDFIKEWEEDKRKLYDDTGGEYHKEPFVSDVTEGKNDPYYNVHTYHTKVPPKAILRYLLHYTRPGDIVLDSMAGTGMTGIGAYYAGQRDIISSLGLKLDAEEVIYKKDAENQWIPFSRLGARRVILNDLSSMATFIAHNYMEPRDGAVVYQEANKVIKEIEDDFDWVYWTLHNPPLTVRKGIVQDVKKATTLDELKEALRSVNSAYIGKINYVVWSDVFICPECSGEVIYWEQAIDREAGETKSRFECPRCKTHLVKRNLERAWTYNHDKYVRKLIKQAKQIPVLINYTFNNERFEKAPDVFDHAMLNALDTCYRGQSVPCNPLPDGYNTRQPIESHGFSHVHHFYFGRTLLVAEQAWKRMPQKAKWFVTSFLARNATKTNRFVVNKHNPRGRINGPLTGTLYVPSLIVEQSVFNLLKDKISSIGIDQRVAVVQTASATQLCIPDQSIDYIFIDPPFGANIMYSEMNFIWESWLKVFTNSGPEAIQNPIQEKTLDSYRKLMVQCFEEAYRVLKPGRWMTVEFSNTQASVWNAIQTALQEAGFVVASVSALDKKHGGIKSMSNPTSVKQDLVISVYKPSGTYPLDEVSRKGSEGIIWDFVDEYLGKMEVFRELGGKSSFIPERDPKIIFDKAVSFFVVRGWTIPMSASEFQEGLANRYCVRDGMIFLQQQVNEYDKKRLLAKEFVQTTLFVSDENSAIEWLRQQLMQKPQTRQDLHPNFMKELQHISKHELIPELDVLLEQNFLMYDGTGPVPSQIHAYLSTDFKDLRNLEKEDPKLQAKAKNRWYVPDPNKQADLEKLRERSLLREFNGYIEELGKSKKKLRQFRTEAIRAGFKTAWGNQDYQTIVDVGQRLPEKVLQEDSTMLMYYDNAQVRLGM